MAEAEKQVGDFQLDLVRDGDIIQDSEVTRAGYTVISREVLVPQEWGMEVFQDHVIEPDGTPGRRKWTNYPEGAVMVVPYRREPGQVVRETTVYLGEGMLLYGIGEEEGIEALGRRKGGKEASEVAREIVESVGLRVDDFESVATINETSSRQNNKTDIVLARVAEEPDAEVLAKAKIMAEQFREVQDLIGRGVIKNAATIAALWFLDGILQYDEKFPDER